MIKTIDQMNFKLTRANLSERIAEQLESMILNNTDKSFSRLPSEQTLAASFSVSRPVIREALILLKARGLISKKNGECANLSAPSVENLSETIRRMVKIQTIDPMDIFAVRVQLEVMSVRLGAEHAGPPELERLRELNRRMGECRSDHAGRAALDFEFHATIAEIGGNPLLALLLRSLLLLLRPMIQRSLLTRGADAHGIRFHERIIAAISSGDPNAAEEIIRAHLAFFMQNYENSRPSPGDSGDAGQNG